MNPDTRQMNTVNRRMQLNGHCHLLNPAHRQVPAQHPPMQHRLSTAHLLDPVAGLVQQRDSLTTQIYKAHPCRLLAVQCLRKTLIHQQART